jgi:hypothetical protein
VAGTGAAPGVLVTSGLAAGRAAIVGALAMDGAGGDAGLVAAPPAATARAAAASAAPTVGELGDWVDVAPLFDDGGAGGGADGGGADGVPEPGGFGFDVTPAAAEDAGVPDPFLRSGAGAAGEDGEDGAAGAAGVAGREAAADGAGEGAAAVPADEEDEDPDEAEPDEPEPADDPDDTAGRSSADLTADAVVTVGAAPGEAAPGRSDPGAVSGRALSSDELTHHLRDRASGNGMSSGSLLPVAPVDGGRRIPLIGGNGIAHGFLVRCRRRIVVPW